MRILHFENVAPGGSLHAALFAVQSVRGTWVATLHTHDFYEMLWVTAGQARHVLNNETHTVSGGDLLFLRPHDCHSLYVRPGEKLHHINVAFPARAWNHFRQIVQPPPDWETAIMPPAVVVPPDRAEACTHVFEAALHHFQTHPSPQQWLHLTRFLSDALPFFHPQTGAAADLLPVDAPLWLREACHALHRHPAYLAEGLPRLEQLAGVSGSHLARTLKAATGQTPTQWINHLRLQRAALLLATTPLSILAIAGECGFDQLSYFYRLFRDTYGASPHAFRLRARRSVAP